MIKKLAVSNIGWAAEDDKIVFAKMKECGFTGLEIAPTRIIAEKPYDNIDKAVVFKNQLEKDYGFSIVSMQSLWYGISELITGTDEERGFLVNYTEKAMKFASAIGCRNLVFGSPKNRSIENEGDEEILFNFFKVLAELAVMNNVVLAIEPNPAIYGTNFLNRTEDAISFCEKICSDGLRVNLDFGTIIENDEDFSIIQDNIKFINHIHISEPYLAKIEERELHKRLCSLDYNGYISIEMGNKGDLNSLLSSIEYVGGIFA